MHSQKTFLDHPSQGKVGSWVLYHWEQKDFFQLQAYTVNILSNKVHAFDSQSAAVLILKLSARKKKFFIIFKCLESE